MKNLARSILGEAKAAGGTMSTRGTCGDLHNAQANSGRCSNDCSSPFLIWKVENGGKYTGNKPKTPLCACRQAVSCLQDRPQDYLHENMFTHLRLEGHVLQKKCITTSTTTSILLFDSNITQVGLTRALKCEYN